jgi:dihydroxyacid dehydratase/phosphogluconate dehydratase
MVFVFSFDFLLFNSLILCVLSRLYGERMLIFAEKRMDHLRSKGLSPDVPQYYIRRAFLESMGYTDRDLVNPLVAIANTWNEILPDSYHHT